MTGGNVILTYISCVTIGPFEFKVEGRSKTAGTAEGCDFWDQNGVLLLHLRVQQQSVPTTHF